MSTTHKTSASVYPTPPSSPAAATPPDSRQQQGRQAETLAAEFLLRQGLRILARNYRVRGGEIDLICADKDMLVFVEVRLRHNQSHGGAIASITPQKQQRIILAARHYLAARRERPCRFDVICLDGLESRNIQWLPNAFAAE